MMDNTGQEVVGDPSSSKAPKFNPTFRVDVQEDYGPASLGNVDYKKREAQRSKIELATIDKVVAMDDAKLAKFARAQLEAQKELCEARIKLANAESMKISDVFADMPKDNDSETDKTDSPAKEKDEGE